MRSPTASGGDSFAGGQREVVEGWRNGPGELRRRSRPHPGDYAVSLGERRRWRVGDEAAPSSGRAASAKAR